MRAEGKITKGRKTNHSVEILPGTLANRLGLSEKLQTPLFLLEFYLKPTNLRYLFQELIIYHNVSELRQKEVAYRVMTENYS